MRLQGPALSLSKGDVVHRAFVDTPPTLITLGRVRFRLRHEETQQCVRSGQRQGVIETPPRLRRVGPTLGQWARTAGRHLSGRSYGEALGAGWVFCIGATRELPGHTRSRMVHLSTGQEPAHHSSPFAAHLLGLEE